jgi:Flp pilus assembly protein TadG
MAPTPHRQRGAIAIMVALALVVLIAAAGLVLDAGLAYLVKARLNAAVDSAALAGARAVTSGANQSAQIASAKSAAATYFAANIPADYMFSKPTLLSTNVTFSGGMATIDVTAKAPMSVSLMQVMGFTELNPQAYAQTIRKDLDMALVMDTSGSLFNVGATVKSSAKTFLNKFNVTQDRVALIHFATGAEVDNAIKTTGRGFNRDAMFTNIGNFVFKDNTDSAEGMWNARNQLNSITSNRSVTRVIVFFSDGAPTALASYINFKKANDCTTPGAIESSSATTGLFSMNASAKTPLGGNCNIYRDINGDGKSDLAISSLPDWYNAHNTGGFNARNDPAQREFPIVTTAANPTPRLVTSDVSTSAMLKTNVDRAARNVTEAIAAKARDEGIVVFTLGLGDSLRQGSGADGEIGEKVLKCMANVTDSYCYNPKQPVGMYCFAATEADLTPCFSRLASAILRITK